MSESCEFLHECHEVFRVSLDDLWRMGVDDHWLAMLFLWLVQ